MVTKTRARSRATEPPDWAEVDLSLPDLPMPVDVLCVDPSLAHTGWVMMTVFPSLQPRISATGTINTKAPEDDERKGYYASFERAGMLFDHFRDLIHAMRPQLTLFEMPAISGPAATKRQDSSLIAGVTLLCAQKVVGLQVIEMMQAQHVKKILTGNGNAPKPFVREQVDQVFPGRKWNEHISDATALGICAIMDGTITRVLAREGSD